MSPTLLALFRGYKTYLRSHSFLMLWLLILYYQRANSIEPSRWHSFRLFWRVNLSRLAPRRTRELVSSSPATDSCSVATSHRSFERLAVELVEFGPVRSREERRCLLFALFPLTCSVQSFVIRRSVKRPFHKPYLTSNIMFVHCCRRL